MLVVFGGGALWRQSGLDRIMWVRLFEMGLAEKKEGLGW